MKSIQAKGQQLKSDFAELFASRNMSNARKRDPMAAIRSNIASSALTQTIADERIPTLQAVLDPHELGRHLDRVLAAQLGKVQDIQINVLQRRHRRRCTVDITLRTSTGKHELIGKVYAEDRSDVYHAMKRINQSGFGPEAEFSIPQPFAFIPELNLLLQEKVQGPLATEIFLTGNESEQAEAAKRCALWLAHCHMRAPMSGPVFVSTHELLEHWMHQKLLEHWLRRVTKRAGPQAGQLIDKAALLFKLLEIAALKHDRVEMRACHGTYCHYQIIASEARTVTLDWDSFCVAHPSLDIARFIIVLQQLALNSHGSLRALDAASEVFCKTYIATTGIDVTRHLAFYKAAHCFKHTRDYLKRDDVRPERAELMLDEGLRILSEEM